MTKEKKTWKYGYDAVENDPLTAHRIPVTSEYPHWYYLVAFDGQSACRPTDQEVAMLVSYLNEYKERWYGDSGYRVKMELETFDVDGGANGVIFHKYDEGSWGYRRRSWIHGFRPERPHNDIPYDDLSDRGRTLRDAAPMSLEQVMDGGHSIGETIMQKWLDWKDAHPEAFPKNTDVVA